MQWKQWKALPPADTSQVHVVAWQLAELGSCPVSSSDPWTWKQHLPLLSEEERGRAARFVFDRHRIPYVQAHARMRQVLATYLGVTPQTITLAAERWGKPCLAGNASSLRFNLSHTDGICVLTIGIGDIEVGVDVERLRPIPSEVAEEFFSEGERVALAALTADDWQGGFFSLLDPQRSSSKSGGKGSAPTSPIFRRIATVRRAGRAARHNARGPIYAELDSASLRLGDHVKTGHT